MAKNFFSLIYSQMSEAERSALPSLMARQWDRVTPEAKKQIEAIPGLMEAIKKELSALDS